MTEVFVVRNQLGQYWGKKKRWVDGSNARRVMTLKHADEGLNVLVELSSKDVELRGEVTAVETDDKRLPQVEPSEHRLVDEDDLAKKAKKAEAEASEADTEAEADTDTDTDADADAIADSEQESTAVEEKSPEA